MPLNDEQILAKFGPRMPDGTRVFVSTMHPGIGRDDFPLGAGTVVGIDTCEGWAECWDYYRYKVKLDVSPSEHHPNPIGIFGDEKVTKV